MRALLLVVITALAGCIDSLQPEVGPLLGPRCDDTDSAPAVTVSFASDILAGIITDRGHCVKCHTPTGATPIGLQLGGLDLSTYETLRSGGNNSATNIVVPGEPCSSVLYRKISPSPPFGMRMPFDGPPHLSDEDIQLVHDWIAEGARDN